MEGDVNDRSFLFILFFERSIDSGMGSLGVSTLRQRDFPFRNDLAEEFDGIYSLKLHVRDFPKFCLQDCEETSLWVRNYCLGHFL